jgi:hypothetical protein
MVGGLQGRLVLWSLAGILALQNPFSGIGFGQFEYSIFPTLKKFFSLGDFALNLSSSAAVTDRVHNEFLDLWLEGGILTLIGIALFTLFFVLSRKFSATAKSVLVFTLLMCCGSFPLHVAPNLALVILVLKFFSEPRKVSSARTVQPWAMGVALTGFVLAIQTPVIYSQWQWGNGKPEVGVRNGALNSAQARLKWTEKLMQSHRESEALELLHQEENKSLVTADLMKLKGRILFSQKRYEETFYTFASLAESYPNQVTPYFMMGEICRLQNHKVQAKMYFAEALKRKPGSEKARFEQWLARSLF